jgi:hypothetical protein
MVTALLLLVLTIGHVTCVEIFFNSSISCDKLSGGCNWNDSTNWVGGVVPSIGTDVYIIFNSTVNVSSPVIYVNYNNLTLHSLTLSGAALDVVNSSTVSSSNLILATATLSIDSTSWVESLSATQVLIGSTVLLGGKFTQTNASEQFTLDATSIIATQGGSILTLNSLLVSLSGLLEIAASSSFYANVVQFHNDVTFPNTPQIGLADFKGVTAYFPQGIAVNTLTLESGSLVTVNNSLGAVELLTVFTDSILYLRRISSPQAFIQSLSQNPGTLFISSSNLTLGNFNSVLGSNLVLAGASTISLTGIEISSLSFSTGEYNEAPYININIAQDPVTFNLNQVQIPGEILIQNGSWVSFVGSSSLTGGILSLGGIIFITGQFTALGPIILVTNPNTTNDSDLSLQGPASLTTPSLLIGELTTLENINNSTITGDVICDGIITIYDIDTLSIIGNFSQGSNAQLVFTEIDPLNNITGFINITGRADIAGTVSYQVLTLNANATGDQVKFLILQASGGVHGKFSQRPINIGLGDAWVDLDYSDPTKVYFVYGGSGDDDKWYDLEWWLWLVIGAGGGIVILAITVITCSVRNKRKGYKAVK